MHSNTKFKPVYSLFSNEKFGYLIGAYIVEENNSGLTLNYQRLLPENLQNFSEFIDEKDKKIATILNEISLQQLYRQFKMRENSVGEFVNNFPKHPHREYILGYIEKRIGSTIPLLKEKLFYRMNKDGYPAYRKLEFTDEKGFCSFSFDRDEKETKYSLEIQLEGKKLDLLKSSAGTLSDQPVWMVANQKVFQLSDPEIERKKITPFCSKAFISIPRSIEKDYFNKVLLKLIQRYPVELKGINKVSQDTEPKFELSIERAGKDYFNVTLNAIYADYKVKVDGISQNIADLIETNDSYTVYLLKRNLNLEKEKIAFFQNLQNIDSTLFTTSLYEDKVYQFISKYNLDLQKNDIYINLIGLEQPFNFNKPIFMPNVKEYSHGTYIEPFVKVGEYLIGFEELKNAIKKRESKIIIPDHSFIYLPDAWIDDLEPIIEMAKKTEFGWRIHPYQAAMLKMTYGDGSDSYTDRLRLFDQIEKQDISPNLKAELREYQHAGYNWLCFLKEFQLGGILADDMGLGKTVQTLSLLQREKDEVAQLPSLIVVPNSLVFNWVDEIKKFTNLTVLVYSGNKRGSLIKMFSNFDVILTTYGLVRIDIDKLTDIQFNYLVLDESHIIKNKDSKLTHAVVQLNSNFKISLTGTPIENSSKDLWTQMQFLNPGLLGNATFFEKFYALPIERDKNEQRSRKLVKIISPLILRRTKEMVIEELPKSEINVLYCNMTEKQQNLYDQTRRLYKSTLFNNSEGNSLENISKNSIQIFSCLQRLRQIAIHPQLIDPKNDVGGKYESIKFQLASVLEQGSKVLIFSQFVKLLTLLKYDLIKDGVKFAYIDGSIKDRKSEVNKFQEEEDCKVFLLSLKAGGVGLNLTAANYVFISDPWWNPAIENQAISRAHRMGQKKHVFGYKFITRNSIEEKILSLQQKKQLIANEIIKTEDAFIKTLTKNDLISLFDDD